MYGVQDIMCKTIETITILLHLLHGLAHSAHGENQRVLAGST